MFKEGRLYRTDDADLLETFTRQTLAHWRSQGRGPAYLKIGPRIFYRGEDLNAWLLRQRVDPTKRDAAAAA